MSISVRAYCPTCETEVEAQPTDGPSGTPIHLTKERGYSKIHDCRPAAASQ